MGVCIVSKRAKQYNYYVNEDEEKELFDFLESFPKMTRSSFVKELIKSHINGIDYKRTIVTKKKNEHTNVLRTDVSFEIDDDDLI